MNQGSQPLVSVVTPVYNDAQYLQECIESVLAQTYTAWNYTVVDNCSTDGSAEIAQRYAKKDPRIQVVECTEFLDAIPNHNRALREIRPAAQYCKVVLSDDWIVPECLEKMVAVAEAHPSIGLVSAYALEGDSVTCTGLPYPSSFVSGREICRQHLLDRVFVFGTPTSVMYRADLVRAHEPFYNAENVHGDTDACFKVLQDSDFGFVHQVLTFTRVRPGSRNVRSTRMQTNWASMLELLLTYGAWCLNRQELDASLDAHLSAYYRFLAKQSILGGDKDSWAFHKKELGDAGVGFSRARWAKAVVELAFDAALNPKRTLEDMFTRGRSGRGNVEDAA